MDFTPFPKIPRLRREITITEKLDGTNAQVVITSGAAFKGQSTGNNVIACSADLDLFMFAGSRTRWITPGKDTDNFGFAGWVEDNAADLFKLGVGTHYGEWWGLGIQRGYDLDEKRFSLFNVNRWKVEQGEDGELHQNYPQCCDVVPVLYTGPHSDYEIEGCLEWLGAQGSQAAPRFMKPEGIVVYHSAARSHFKVLLEGDDIPKGNQ